MNKLKQHMPKILIAASLTLAAGLAIFSTSQAFVLRQEVTALKNDLQEKSEQITRMQDDLGKEVTARSACEASLAPIKEQLASASSKLESFALQAASCEQLRRKIRK